MALPAPQKVPAISPWTGEFQDPSIEARFRRDALPEWARQSRLVAWVSAGFYLAGLLVDYCILGLTPKLGVLLATRVLFALLAWALGRIVTRLASPFIYDVMVLAVLLACGAATCIIIFLSPAPMVQHALTVFVLVIVFYLFVPCRLVFNALCALAFSTCFVVGGVLCFAPTSSALTLIVLYLVLANFLGGLATQRLHYLRRLQYANLQAERQAQALLLKEVEERKRAERSLRELASGVAHNFNNSLMAITSNLQAAQNALGAGQDLATVQALLENAWQSAAGGREVARRLSRAVGDSSGPEPEQSPQDLCGLILRAKEIARHTWASGPSAPRFEAELEPDLWVMATRGELMEVLLNLFKNSLEAMPRGGRIQVRARRDKEAGGEQDGGCILLEVSDDGPGISPEMQKRLFKPFATDKGVAGQGLGLAVSREIISGLGGSITCHSQPGQGTTMRIELPAIPPPPAPLESGAESVLEPGSSNGGRRVLLVEDEVLVSMGVATILRQAGYQVWLARDVEEAALKLSEAAPQWVVCDFGLPDGNAWHIHQEAQNWARTSGRPAPAFIVLTGWGATQLADDPEARAVQPFAWLQKPVVKEELLEALHRAGQAARGQARAEE